MDSHQLIEILIACVGSGIVWWVNIVWRKTEQLADALNSYKLEVSEKYVPAHQLNRIMDKLDDIEALLHTKADRGHGGHND